MYLALFEYSNPFKKVSRWRSGNTCVSHLWGWQLKPQTLSAKVGSCLSLSYIPSYVHVRPGYREKSPDLQGTLKSHLHFITESQGRTGPAMKIDMHISCACTQDVYKRIHASRVT